MSDGRADDEAMEGWSIVRHRPKDEMGSDADSVEVISEDSDRDTCDEGKDDKESIEDDKEPVPTTDPDSTTPEADDQVDTDGGSSDQSEDLRSQLVDLDPLGDLTSTLSDKLHHLISVGSSSSLSREEIQLRYVIFASALLALICSLLVSSYLMFIKLNHMVLERQRDHMAAHAFQDLDEVISKLRKVLHLENEQHLRDILSKIPADYLTLEQLIPMADHLPRQLPANTVQTPEVTDGKTVASSDQSDGKTVPSSDQSFGAKTVHYPDNLGSDSFQQHGKHGHSRIPEQSGQYDMKTSCIDESRQTTLQDQPKPDRQLDAKPQTDDIPDSANPPNAPNKAANSSTRNTPTTELPTQNKTGFYQTEPIEKLLISVRQDVISIQKDIYSQILNSLLEYKIDLYKNLLRADLDISCRDRSNNKANHKNFMLFRSLQQMIAKSSESNFESWYKFYSYSVFPKIWEVVSKIDSIAEGSGSTRSEPHSQKGKEWMDKLNDDFFIRAGDPHVEPAVTVETGAKQGFDWKNLDKKIRESMRNTLKHGRMKNSEADGYMYHEKHRGDEGKQQNFVKIGQDFERRKDRHGKNNLKGDFRKRKASENDHKKHGLRDFEQTPQIHIRAEHENDKRSHEHQVHDRAGNKQDRELDKGHEKQEGQKHGERDSKNDERGHEKSKNEDRDKKRKHEGMRKHRKHERKFKEHDERKSHTPDESKHDHKNDDRHFEKDFVTKEDKYKQERDYSDYEYKDFRSHYKDKKSRRKISFSDIGKYVKNTVSGLWKTVKGGFKNVKDYSKSYIKDWRLRKPKESGKYEEWRKEFVKEMKDVIRVLGGNPTLATLSEVPKSVSKILGDGLGSIMRSFGDEWEDKGEMGPEGLRPGPEGMKEDSMCYADVCEEEEVSGDQDRSKSTSEGYTSDEGYESEGYKTPETPYSNAPNHRGTEPAGPKTGSWYYDAAKHRADARRHPGYPRASDSSWFLGLGRHRAYLRRRGIHLDDDGSWFISSAKHRAKMRQKHVEEPSSPYFYSQASSKR